MGCDVQDWIGPDGSPAKRIVCSRGSKKQIRQNCDIPGCPNGSQALCDWPMAGEGRTCDKHLCAQHRRPAGKNRNYCPEHFNVAMRGR